MNCTKCGSTYIEERRIGAGVGAVTGGAAGGFAASDCFTSDDDNDEGFGILGFLTSVAIGAAVGTVAGSLLDGTAIDNYKCNDCGHTFKAGDDPMDRAAKALSTVQSPEYGSLINSTVHKRNIFETVGEETSELGEYARKLTEKTYHDVMKHFDNDISEPVPEFTDVDEVTPELFPNPPVPKYLRASKEEMRAELTNDADFEYLIYLYGDREEYMFDYTSADYKSVPVAIHMAVFAITMCREMDTAKKEWEKKHNQA